METKLNGYVLREELKKKMRDTLHKTQQSKVEMGFTLCSKPDNIIRSRWYNIGDSYEIEINLRSCEKDEKYLGGYHTHPGNDSHASARDLRYCGMAKMMCIGGHTDNKIRCYTWKHEQPSPGELNKIVGDIKKGIISSENLRYQQHFDCLYAMDVLHSKEMDIREKLDKELDKMKSDLLILHRSSVSERKIEEAAHELINETLKRDMRANKLKEEIDNGSKKYYNDIEIKWPKITRWQYGDNRERKDYGTNVRCSKREWEIL